MPPVPVPTWMSGSGTILPIPGHTSTAQAPVSRPVCRALWPIATRPLNWSPPIRTHGSSAGLPVTNWERRKRPVLILQGPLSWDFQFCALPRNNSVGSSGRNWIKPLHRSCFDCLLPMEYINFGVCSRKKTTYISNFVLVCQLKRWMPVAGIFTVDCLLHSCFGHFLQSSYPFLRGGMGAEHA